MLLIERYNNILYNLFNKKVMIFLQKQVKNFSADYYIMAKDKVALMKNFIK